MALTEREKLVLFGLIKWPNLSDTELTEKLDIKRPTITSIRNRLSKEGYFEYIVIPNLAKIGCELITVFHSVFNPLTDFSIRKKYANLVREHFKDYFFVAGTDRERAMMAASRNFTELREQVDYTERVYWSQGFLTDKGSTYAFFPLEYTRIFPFFDYGNLLHNQFGLNLEIKREPLKAEFEKVGQLDLKQKEKLIFYALVKYPTLNDVEIGEKLSLSRQTVSSVRKRFLEDNMLLQRRIPNIKKLGFGLLVFAHSVFNPNFTLEERLKRLWEFLSLPAFSGWYDSKILDFSSNLESVTLTVFQTYAEFQKYYGNYLSFYKKEGFLLRETAIRIFSIKDLTPLSEIRFDPLIKKFMGINEEI